MNDLNDLIGKAKHDIDLEEKNSLTQPIRGHLNSKPIVMSLVIVTLTVWIYHFLNHNLSKDTIQNDLTELAIQAGESILAYYKHEKALTPDITETSLRGLLRYKVVDAQSQPPKFILEGEIEGMSLKWSHPSTEGAQ
jgi:hypothetical protein